MSLLLKHFSTMYAKKSWTHETPTIPFESTFEYEKDKITRAVHSAVKVNAAPRGKQKGYKEVVDTKKIIGQMTQSIISKSIGLGSKSNTESQILLQGQIFLM